MKSQKFNSIKKSISVVLSVVLIVAMLEGCSFSRTSYSADTIVPEVDTSAIAESIIDELQQNSDLQSDGAPIVSLNWEDYVGDFETFVYGLISNELKYGYYVFPAYVQLDNGLDVHGLAYTDFSSVYTNEDESQVVVEAGLLPYCGETGIPDEQFNEGLEIINCDYQDNITTFVLAYQSDAFEEHCVVYENYLKCGVNDKGQIFFETEEYDQSICDESLGALYSFDEEKYLYDTDFGNYISISGNSLYTEYYYDELEKAINAALDEQDSNFVSLDIETNAYIAQEAVATYFLSMQEETFLGYDVDYLVELVNELDPTECYRFTQDGLVAVDFDRYNTDASEMTKWIVGSACIIATVVSFVSSYVFRANPVYSGSAGAISGFAIEIFMQVVVSDVSIDSIKWNEVLVSVISGAISGCLQPCIQAQFADTWMKYFLVDSFVDGLIGGTERTVIAWMDGEEGQNMLEEFGYGFTVGFALSAGFKVVGEIIEKLASNATPILEKLVKKLIPNLTSRVAPFVKILGKKFEQLQKVADSSRFHSEYLSRKLTGTHLLRVQNEEPEDLFMTSFRALNNRYEILDVDGIIIPKSRLKEIFASAQDGDTLGYIRILDDIVEVIKCNGAIGVRFDPHKYQTVDLGHWLVNDRDANFKAAAELFIESWKKDESLIPESIRMALKERGIDINDLKANKLVEIIQNSDMVLHENLDMHTITLVARSVHDKIEGGVAHMGGYALAEYLKHNIGTMYFERFMAAASSAFAAGG